MNHRTLIRNQLKLIIDQNGLSRYTVLIILNTIDSSENDRVTKESLKERRDEMRNIFKEILILDYPFEAPTYIGMIS